MRRIIFINTLLFVFACGQAQVFNAGTSLSGNIFSFGMAPTLYGSKNLAFFLHGNLKIQSGTSLIARIGLGGVDYFGGAVRMDVNSRLGLIAGLHHEGNIGLDGTLFANFPLTKEVVILTGLDMDVVFGENDVRLPFWLPIGLEVKLNSAFSLLMEADIGLSNPAPDIFSLGIILFL